MNVTAPLPASTAPPGFDALVAEALRCAQSGISDEGLLATLLLYRQALHQHGAHARLANNQVLHTGLSALRRHNPHAADLLALRYLDNWPIDRVANKLNFAESTIYRQQREAIHQLTGELWQLEQACRRQREQRVAARVELPESLPLIGVEEQVGALAEHLAEPGPPWVISIEGIGGIGKTALARAVLFALAASVAFDDFAWASAQPLVLDLRGTIRNRERPSLTAAALVVDLIQQLAPEDAPGLLMRPEQALNALRDRLKANPHLVVIDNLETVADLEELLPTLHGLAGPSKFVLTSRQRLIGDNAIYLHAVRELSEPNALALVRRAAAQHNIPGLPQAADADLHPLYEAAGGNPLALLLLVGQLHISDLDTVVADLRGARGAPVENLYTFVYRRAWDHLDEPCRRVLLTMSLVTPRGDGLPFITATCGLAAGEVTGALQQLIRLNLVYTTGDWRGQRYAIHSLTRSFLHEQVAQWQ